MYMGMYMQWHTYGRSENNLQETIQVPRIKVGHQAWQQVLLLTESAQQFLKFVSQVLISNELYIYKQIMEGEGKSGRISHPSTLFQHCNDIIFNVFYFSVITGTSYF